MLDVHLPEHTPHGVRDFFLHIFTITVGLLIALGLEAAVEWRHHVHLRQEAQENIVSEIRDNQHELADVLEHIPAEKQSLASALAFLDARAQNQQYVLKNLSLGMDLGSYRDASFQTANTTGALGYMDYAQVKTYSAVYTLQAQFFQLQTQTLTAYLTVQSYLVDNEEPDKIAPEEAQRARSDVQRTYADLIAMEQVGRALQLRYADALKDK